MSLGHSKSYGNHMLALMLLVGGLGTLAAGPIADRVGLRTVLVGTSAVSGPLILVFVLVGGIPGAIALAGVGAAVIGSFAITMVLAQEYLPRHIGMASGLSIGFSIGLGGVAAVILGAVADSIDLRTSLYVCAAAPVVCARADGAAPAHRRPRPGSSPRSRCREVGSAGNHERSSKVSDSVNEFFAGLPSRVDPAKTAGMNNSYVFDIEGAGTWTVKVADGSVTVDEGNTGGDCAISTSAETFEQVVKGEQNPTAAYMSGKLKIKGDMGAAMKLQKLF